jgi:BetR domain
MTTVANSQDFLFQRIKEMLPQYVSIVDAVSEILHVSNDSAYRRIRGETPLVLEEVAVLCRHFNLSLDHLLEAKNNSVLFRNTRVRNHQYTYRQYLQGLTQQMEAINNFMQKEIIYMSKDLPIFHNFYFKPLIAFRYFFWMKTHLAHPDFEKLQFSFDILPPDIEQMSMDLTRDYTNVPSTEMWNTESINSTISQIEFSKDSGHFSSPSDSRIIYEALEETIHHMKEQAEYGCKFMPGEDPQSKKPNFKFFFNRVALGDNTIMTITDNAKSAIINYGHLNYIITNDESFCNDLFGDFENLIRRSTQISETSEKQRNLFFNILLTKIQDRKRN